MSIWRSHCPECNEEMVWVGFDQDERGYKDYFRCFGEKTHMSMERTSRGTMPVIPVRAYPVPKEVRSATLV